MLAHDKTKNKLTMFLSILIEKSRNFPVNFRAVLQFISNLSEKFRTEMLLVKSRNFLEKAKNVPEKFRK